MKLGKIGLFRILKGVIMIGMFKFRNVIYVVWLSNVIVLNGFSKFLFWCFFWKCWEFSGWGNSMGWRWGVGCWNDWKVNEVLLVNWFELGWLGN